MARRVDAGRLHRVHQGVYAVGSPSLSQEGRWLAAVLACGRGTVLSHRSAAELWDMLRPERGPVHVTVRGDAGRKRRRGAMVHRSTTLGRGDCTRRRGIPVTIPARTLADLRGSLPARLVRRAQRQAEVMGLPLAAERRSDRTRSDLERRFLALCRRHGLPAPKANVKVGPDRVDFLWRQRRLVVEIDSYAYHGNRVAFEEDRERDRRLQLRAFEVARFTDTELDQNPQVVMRAVRRFL